MKRRNIRIIIGLMSFALLGVITMQLYFLVQSFNMQSELFDSTVNGALNNVVDKLSRHDADRFLAKKATGNSNAHYRFNAEVDNAVSQQYEPKIKIISNDTLQSSASIARKKRMDLLTDSLQRLILSQKFDEAFSGKLKINFDFDNFGNMQGRVTALPQPRSVKPNGKISKYDTTFISYTDPLYGPQIVAQLQLNEFWEKEQMRKKKERSIRQVKRMISEMTEDSLKKAAALAGNATSMENLLAEYQRSGEPLKKRLDKQWIDSLLKSELQGRGIDLAYNYDVTNANNDSLIFSSVADGKKPQFTADNTYKTAIFTKDVVNDPGMLKVSFPEKNSFVLGHLKESMATTAGLLFVLIFCFAYTLMTIIRQKKISEMKTDFINNMTHEFKTPVSTIMIASESLRDPEISADRSRITRLANIIYEENARLGSHIERVLNVARIDKNDFKLENKPVNINDLIAIVLDSMELKLQKCDADIKLELSAENPVIIADELHFSNVLYNLVDNAIKYSEGKPRITISSFNKTGQVVIKVADEGIGMSRDQQTKIFEQFYRIPTGNVHNVKGFGLGLSYVNTIVKRLNGSISVRSEKDKGSEFELKFATA
ncbi:sensor histidine kinase [Mucilaginibacter calamicampi]|uniref:histidine kinase n=1 Tax=Mucilaginibacter calamicampi TaxID=1302352 RepID=A0ABW2YZV0_9SPHI